MRPVAYRTRFIRAAVSHACYMDGEAEAWCIMMSVLQERRNGGPSAAPIPVDVSEQEVPMSGQRVHTQPMRWHGRLVEAGTCSSAISPLDATPPAAPCPSRSYIAREIHQCDGDKHQARDDVSPGQHGLAGMGEHTMLSRPPPKPPPLHHTWPLSWDKDRLTLAMTDVRLLLCRMSNLLLRDSSSRHGDSLAARQKGRQQYVRFDSITPSVSSMTSHPGVIPACVPGA